MAVRIYTKTTGKIMICTSYMFDQVSCDNTEFWPPKKQKTKKQERDKTNLGGDASEQFSRPFCFILCDRRVNKFYIDIYYIIS